MLDTYSRNKIYRLALSRFLNTGSFTNGICVHLNNGYNNEFNKKGSLKSGDLLNLFPEFKSKCPDNILICGYWFIFDEQSRQKRIEILKQCINETN